VSGTTSLYYFSSTTTGMGYSPPPELAYIYYKFTDTTNKGLLGTTYNLYNLVSSTGTLVSDGSNPMGGSFLRGVMQVNIGSGIGIGPYNTGIGSITATWTICFWVRGTPANMTNFMFFSEGTFLLAVTNGGLNVNAGDTSWPLIIPNVFNGVWNFVALRSSSIHIAYINGIKSTYTDYNRPAVRLGTIYANNNQNRLFSSGGSGDTCDLDKFRMFNISLSDAQVSLLYNYNYTRTGV